MKKFILTLFALFATVVSFAANYTVTVTTQQVITYRDSYGNEVATEKVVGNAMTFQVVADTPRQAEDSALSQCQGACDSGFEVLAATGVTKNGKVCDKFIKTIPWKAEAKLAD